MSISLVQSSSAVTHITGVGPAPGTRTISKAFTTNNTASNAIMVAALVGGGNGAGYGVVTPVSMTDTQGNTYTQVLFTAVGNQAGAATAFYYATGIAAGANTVTFSFTAPSFNSGISFTVDPFIAIAEYSGLGAFTVQAVTHQNIFGAAGNSPSVLTITDSHAASVSTTIGSPFGIGTINTGCLLVDILSGTANYLIEAALSSSTGLTVPTTSPAGYQTFVNRELNIGANGYTGYYWDSGSVSTAQPQTGAIT